MPPSTIGALWIMGGMAVIAVSDNFVALVADRLSLWHLQAIRSALVLPFAVALALLTGQTGRLWPKAPRRVLERTLFTTLAILLYFAAVPAVGVAQAAAGLFASPIWVVVFAGLLFGEGLGPRRVLAVVIGFLGVCLVLEIGDAPVSAMTAVAVAAGASYAMGVIWTRRHCPQEAALSLAIWQFTGLMIAGLLGIAVQPYLSPMLSGIAGTEFATRPWTGISLETFGIVAGIGAAGMVASACLAQGYKSGESSLMALFDFSFLFWVPLFAWIIWGTPPAANVVAGMVLIVCAGALAVWSGARRGAAPAAGADPRMGTARPPLPGPSRRRG